jgi:hypothetical protein
MRPGRMDRNRWAFSNTLYTNWDIVLKDEDYSDWYREMEKIRQARRGVGHPMNRGVFF